MPKIGIRMRRVQVTMRMGLVTFSCVPKFPSVDSMRMQSNNIYSTIIYWQYETVSWNVDNKTVECLHFEHSSSFEYSVINVVDESDGNGNGRECEQIIIIIINKVLIKVTLNKVITGALYIVCGWLLLTKYWLKLATGREWELNLRQMFKMQSLNCLNISTHSLILSVIIE